MFTRWLRYKVMGEMSDALCQNLVGVYACMSAIDVLLPMRHQRLTDVIALYIFFCTKDIANI